MLATTNGQSLIRQLLFYINSTLFLILRLNLIEFYINKIKNNNNNNNNEKTHDMSSRKNSKNPLHNSTL